MKRSVYLTRAFWQGAGERALKTAGQAGGVLLGSNVTGLLDIDPGQFLSVTGLSALASLLTSIATPNFVAGGSEETGE